MKKYFFGVLTGFIVCTIFVSTFAIANTPIKLIVNGNLVESDVPPQIISGRTMIPARPLAEALGAKVEWDAENNAVVVTGGIQVDAKPIDLEPVKNEESQVIDNNIKSSGGENMNTAISNTPDIKTFEKDGHTVVVKDGVEYYQAHWIDNVLYQKKHTLGFNQETKTVSLMYNEHPAMSLDSMITVLENIPYEVIEGRTFIKKEVYEDMILPIVNNN
jgi:hypothetical protein